MANIYARVTQNQKPSYKDLRIDQGATFSDTIVLRNIDDTAFDLTGWSVRGKLRRSISSSTAQDFTCTVTDAANGIFTINLSSTVTESLTAQNYMTTIYHYDIEIYNNDSPPIVYKVLRGRALLYPEITR